LNTEKKVDRYKYDRFGSKGARVGQAVVDIMSKEQPSQTVEETIFEFGPDFAKEFEKTVNKNAHKYKSPFHVVVLTKKEMWACNVVRNFFIARQTAPKAKDMIIDYPNHTKTLYKVNTNSGEVKAEWSIPGHQECISLSKSPGSYDPQLVKWIDDAYKDLYTDPK
jgi:hypothetical protein